MEWAVGMRSVRKASGAGPTYMCCETNSCLESGAGPTYMCCETNSCLEKQCEPLLSKRSHAMIGASCEQWTHWDLNPGPSACEADVIPLHHVPSDCQGPLLNTTLQKARRDPNWIEIYRYVAAIKSAPEAILTRPSMFNGLWRILIQAIRESEQAKNWGHLKLNTFLSVVKSFEDRSPTKLDKYTRALLSAREAHGRIPTAKEARRNNCRIYGKIE